MSDAGLRDYVFLCFLMGNDFLPHPFALSIRDKGIEVALRIYSEVRLGFADSEHSTLVYPTPCGTRTLINAPFFTEVLRKLGAKEDSLVDLKMRGMPIVGFTSCRTSDHD